MNISHATPELFAALAAAQLEIENASKTSANPHFKSRYADLAEVLNTVRPVLARHGISIMQSTAFDGAMVTVDTVLAHASGGYVQSSASCVPAKSDGQGIGSSTTYLRRYSLAAICGVSQEDDDGNTAAHNAPPRKVTAISADRAQALRDMLRDKGVEEAKFVGWLGAGSLETLTDAQATRGEQELSRRPAKGEAA